MNNLMFFGEPVKIARYDVLKYPIFDKLTKQQRGYFWTEEEVDISKDTKDFRSLTESEQHIFTSNLKRQILLDTVQGVQPSLAFLPICSQPELETWIQTWTFFETIHSRSYTHIIRNIYSNPSELFDGIMDIKEIVDCASDITRYYDNLIRCNYRRAVSGYDSTFTLYDHKKALWLALMSVNVLEGIRFYVSFCASWAIAEQKKMMEGNAKIIKFICRDENIHLASTQHMLKLLVKSDPDFLRISEETSKECVEMYESAVAQEKGWADYLFMHGSMVGLNAEILKQYVEWVAHKRMVSVGLPSSYKAHANPLPWTQKWIGGADVQVAPQQTTISSYVVGAVKQDVSRETFAGFSL